MFEHLILRLLHYLGEVLKDSGGQILAVGTSHWGMNVRFHSLVPIPCYLLITWFNVTRQLPTLVAMTSPTRGNVSSETVRQKVSSFLKMMLISSQTK